MSPWGPKYIPSARRLTVAMSASQIEHQMFLEATRDQVGKVPAKISRPVPGKRTERKSDGAIAVVDAAV